MARESKGIPNRLWQYRNLMGFTQLEVAEKLGLANTSMISRWESGVTMPSSKNLLKLSKLYKTLANELYWELGKEIEKELFPASSINDP
ncbi:MAG: helix-turn-helix transcriptional regulator [Flavipsychrobacter sp.]|nr:helix-turn-helix transcriptional regulator [Flavipsychrobacter sp.]